MAETRMGRPRSESSRRAILEAMRDLTKEVGFGRVTMDSIAARAGAGKQTLYRWWTSKAHILADAVVEGYLGLPGPSMPDTGDLDSDLKAWVAATAEGLSDPAARQIVRALAAAASEDEEEAGKLYAHSTGPQYRLLIARLKKGQETGQLAASADPTAIADALMGAVLFRLLAGLPFDGGLSGVVDALLAAPGPAPGAASSSDVDGSNRHQSDPVRLSDAQ